jgi:hypothetical protein
VRAESSLMENLERGDCLRGVGVGERVILKGMWLEDIKWTQMVRGCAFITVTSVRCPQETGNLIEV